MADAVVADVQQNSNVVPAVEEAPTSKPLWRIYIEQNKLGVFGIILVAAIVLLSVIGPLFMRGSNLTDVSRIFEGPSRSHPLGFDFAGRDIWWQIVHGGRMLLVVALVTGIFSTVAAVIVGALMALIGGWFDTVMQMFAQVVMTVPQIIMLAVLAAFIRVDNPFLFAAILASLSWPGLALAVRTQVLSLREREYVEAARMLDLGTSHIMFKEVLPNMMSYIAINFVFGMSGAIYAQSGLYFLGLISISGANWAVMIAEAFRRGAAFNNDAMIALLAPIAMIALLIWGLTLIQRSLEDVFNPRLRQG